MDQLPSLVFRVFQTKLLFLLLSESYCKKSFGMDSIDLPLDGRGLMIQTL